MRVWLVWCIHGEYDDRWEDVLAIYDNEAAALEHQRREEGKCEKREETEGPGWASVKVTNLYREGEPVRYHVHAMEVTIGAKR